MRIFKYAFNAHLRMRIGCVSYRILNESKMRILDALKNAYFKRIKNSHFSRI